MQRNQRVTHNSVPDLKGVVTKISSATVAGVRTQIYDVSWYNSSEPKLGEPLRVRCEVKSSVRGYLGSDLTAL